MAQDFMKDYKAYLMKNRHLKDTSAKMYIDSSISRLSRTLKQFEVEKKRKFLADTIYMIKMYGMESGEPSLIIWDVNGSCYYHYSSSLENWKVVNKKLKIITDASNMIKSIDPEFKSIVMAGDIEALKKYDSRHQVLDGEGITFTRAIRRKQKWIFTSGGSKSGMYIYNSFDKQ
ncbi:hypothetical protein BEL04_04180 [Mucilaginibacter sp. PPCGB 2223]|uniref:hypothetical protein n=1 Tax=Mucilaginibacter sp. PPCGB 2223 TaxID=1886027 RepID=UPI000824BB0E|nr:hypothetical protein [Mucilaginibacter sp. PPCGB 2223]OCX53505.1 hypothetical protein BEL04_04180 [Mucilaginibacter sp. PPCGB 2223]